MDRIELEHHLQQVRGHVVASNERRVANDLLGALNQLACAIRLLTNVNKRLWWENQSRRAPVEMGAEQTH